MKVTSIETAVLHVPCPRPMSLEFPDHRMVAAFIDTDEGVRGFGYTLAFGGGGAEAIQVYLETRLKPLLIGEDPRIVGKLWEKMFRANRGIRRVCLAGYGVAALDIALWDLTGKIAAEPLFRMWGAVTDRVEAYGSGGWANYAVDDIIGERHDARYLMPDVCRANGFSEALKIGHLAAAHGLMVSPHVVHEISLHVAAALPNAFLVEYMNWAPDDLFVDLPKCENGWFRVPERPGHGLMLTPDALKKYKAR